MAVNVVHLGEGSFDGGALTTSGNMTIDYTGYWPNGVYPWDSTSYPYYQYAYQWPTYPVVCSSDCHVFACEHATKCKCGKASRKPEPQKCGTCGK